MRRAYGTEITRCEQVAASSSVDPLARLLALAADQFIAKREDGYTVMARYPWFTDWGRDTMIALAGLTLPMGYGHPLRKTFCTNLPSM